MGGEGEQCRRTTCSRSFPVALSHFLSPNMDPTFSAPFPTESTYTSALPPFLAPLGSVLDRLQGARESLKLGDPGKAEELGREVKSAFPSLYHLCFLSVALEQHARRSR